MVLLGALYFGLVALITLLLPTQNTLAVAGSTLSVAALFNPVRRRVQRGIDRHFNRSAYQGERIAEQFTVTLRQALTAEELAERWSSTVSAALQPSFSGIWLKTTMPTQPQENSPRPYQH